jgi:hypothetical protein
VPRLILLLAVIAVIYYFYRSAQAMPPPQRRAANIKLWLGIGAVVLLLLAATGRMNWVGAVFAALLVVLRQSLPLLIRLFPTLLKMHTTQPSGGGHTSTVETSLLRMQLDHDTGKLQGEVLRGTFQSRQLANMDRQQLQEFRHYCQREDNDSLRLLDNYLQQRFPDASFAGGQSNNAPSRGHSMDRAEALAVLGLKEGATRDEIVAAHRQLIQKLHPDRGGNDYLASQINRARDVLI